MVTIEVVVSVRPTSLIGGERPGGTEIEGEQGSQLLLVSSFMV